MADPIINDVSDTALWVAHYRAQETKRPDALFQDPLAERLAGEKGKQIAAKMMGSRYTAWTLAIRTVVIDAYITELVATGVDTVINLGAGLDTRPYRLDLPPALRWVEADFPRIIHHKEKILAAEKPRCKLERIAIDLADANERRIFLARVGSESKRALILTEGVTPYLSEEQVSALAADLLAQPAFRYWLLDYYSKEVKRHMQSKRRMRQMRNSPFIFFPENWVSFFEERGWKLREMRYIGETSRRLGRALPTPWWVNILISLFGAQDKTPLTKMSGYALLEPKS